MTSFCQCDLCKKIANDQKYPKCPHCNDHHDSRMGCPEIVKANRKIMGQINSPIPPEKKSQIAPKDCEYYIEIANGKYTLYQTKEGEPYAFKALRYGESWQDLTGNNMVFFLMVELIEAKNKLKDIKFMTQQNEHLNGIVSCRGLNGILKRKE